MSGVVNGRAAAPGVGVGALVRWDLRDERSTPARESGHVDERARLAAAIVRVERELAQMQQRLDSADAAAILDFQRELLRDPELRARIDETLDEHGAAAALTSAMGHFVALLETLDDANLRERAADVRDLERRLLRALSGRAVSAAMSLAAPSVLSAQRFFPSDLLEIDREKLAGLCLSGVGAGSHVVLLARALGVPVVLCDSTALRDVPDGARVLVDGQRGRIVIEPSDAEIAASQQEATMIVGGGPGRGGVRITAVVGSIAEAQAARARGAAGIGLLRTEFLFAGVQRTFAPSVAEQAAAYRMFAEIFPEDGITIRLFDAGGDKPLPFLPVEQEANPALGTRGVRLLLKRPGLLRDQMRAIISVAHLRAQVRLLVPMVTDVGELLRVRAVFDEECGAIDGVERPQFGVMIEVPAAALMADVLAEHVDFFSIGTNDLAQYTLAVDRDDARYAAYGDALHPAVLRLVEMTVRAAHAHGRPVSVCGEAAGRVDAAAALMALGVDELAVG